MPTYTNLLQSQFQEISPYDENFTEELLSIAQLFRPFSDAMDEFLLEHGYAGNIDDVEAKVAFTAAGDTPLVHGKTAYPAGYGFSALLCVRTGRWRDG